MAANKKPALKRGASRYQAPVKKLIPGWLWMAIGLSVGTLIVFLTELQSGKGADVRRIKQEQQKVSQVAEVNEMTPSPAQPVKPKYDFYALLPKSEEIVSEKTPTPLKTTTLELVTSDKTAEIDTVRAQAALNGLTPPPAAPAIKTAPVIKIFLQVGSFRKQADAEKVQAEIILLGQKTTVEAGTVKNKIWYRVLVGPYSKREQLAVAQAKLAESKFNTLLLQQRR